MVVLNDEFLARVGLEHLSRADRTSLLAQIRKTLETRVGTVLAQQMGAQQLDEFEELLDADEKEAAKAWLDAEMPHHPQVVAEQLEKLADEIRTVSSRILSVSLPAAPTLEARTTPSTSTYRSPLRRHPVARPKALRIAVAQIDYVARLVTRSGHWIPHEAAMQDDPLARIVPGSSVKDLLVGSLSDQILSLLRSQDMRTERDFEAKLRQILQFARASEVDVLVLPEGCCPPSALDLLREYSDELAIFCGLGRLRDEDDRWLPRHELGDLLQHNAAVFIDQREVAFVTKRVPADAEQAESGTGPIVVELRRHGRTYHLVLAICLDYLNAKSTFSEAGEIDAVLVTALSPVTADFTNEPPRNYIRVFANHARYGGSTVIAPGIAAPAFAERDRAQPLPPGAEGVMVVDFSGFGKRPSGTLPPSNALVARANILYKTENSDQDDAYSVAGQLARVHLHDFRSGKESAASARAWLAMVGPEPAAAILREGLEALITESIAGTLTSDGLTLFSSHIRLDEGPTTVETRYVQLVELRDLLRSSLDLAEPSLAIGGYIDFFRRLVDGLAPRTRRKYRREEHQYVPIVKSPADQESGSASNVFFAVQLGPYDTTDAVASLPRQLAALHTLTALRDDRIRLRYRLSTTGSEDGDLRATFDVIGIAEGADEIEVAGLREGLGQQLGRAFSGAWHVNGTSSPPKMGMAHTLGLHVVDTRAISIREDWSPLVDFLRALSGPVGIEMECRWTDEDADVKDSERFEVLDQVVAGFATEPEEIAARFFHRVVRSAREVRGSLTLQVKVGSEAPLHTSTVHAIGIDLLGHANFTIVEDDDDSPSIGRFSPEVALRLFHPPYGTMESRGVNSTRPTSIVLSGHSFPKDGVVVGKARTARGREDQISDVTLSDAARRRHMYIIGRSGSGKTNLLKYLARQDIAAGRGVAVIDPHGDLVDYLLGHLGDRAESAVFLDFGDPDHIPVLNPLDLDVRDSADQSLAIEEFINILVKQSYHEFYGPRFEDIVRLTLESISSDVYPFTPSVLDVARLLRSPKRRTWLRSMLKNSEFEERWKVFESQRDTEIGEVLHWALSKFSEMSEDGVLGQVLSGGRSSVSIDAVVSGGGVLLVRLPEWEMSSSAANFLGTLIQERVRRAAYGRWRSRAAKDRTLDSFHLYVDEFQNFATTGFEDLVAEARKFGLCLTLANQNLGQLSRFSRFTGGTSGGLLEAILGNVATFAVFNVSNRDAGTIADELGASREAVRGIGNWSALMRTISAEGTTVGPFTVEMQNADLDRGSPRSHGEMRERMVGDGIWRSRRDIAQQLSLREQEMARMADSSSTKPSSFLDDWLKKRREELAAKDADTRDDQDAAEADDADPPVMPPAPDLSGDASSSASDGYVEQATDPQGIPNVHHDPVPPTPPLEGRPLEQNFEGETRQPPDDDHLGTSAPI